jgi:hypothetical protein
MATEVLGSVPSGVLRKESQVLCFVEAERVSSSPVVDIPNGYTSDAVSYRQTRVAHGGGMADSQPGSLVAGGMAD